MCGIVGFLSPSNNNKDGMLSIISKMADAISHRGPDDSGNWINEEFGIALGHQRLSIIDISPAGHQPMISPSGRYIISFNGEIYNHRDIRKNLEKNNINPSWKGTSDTETFLAAIDIYGIESTLNITVGMFAIAIWDKKNKQLTLIRDRFGEKPLYYGRVGRAFVFASELKAIKIFPDFTNPIDREILDQYLRLMYVPTPFSIYKGIYKLEPGSSLTIDQNFEKNTNLSNHALSAQTKSWWSHRDTLTHSMKNTIDDETEAKFELENSLENSVKIQSNADVPLGAFLSGGVDSSTIVALMQKQTSKPIKTFTIGFENKKFDESLYAKKVAKHLGTDHSELFVTSLDAQDVIPKLSSIYDEPFADSSQIPTYLVCKAAKQNVTVALSGDGGDELFGGYNRYIWGPNLWSKLIKLPFSLRYTIGTLLTILPESRWDLLNQLVNKILFSSSKVFNLGNKIYKVSNRLKEIRNLDDVFLKPITEWPDKTTLVKGIKSTYLISKNNLNELTSAIENKMMYYDLLSYLPDDILCKVDRAAMSVSLETRAPFLDHRVAQTAWRIPLKMKINNKKGKSILKDVLYNYVPKELIDRPKMGFGVPVGQWIRGPLRDWAESFLDQSRLEQEGYLHTRPIRKAWEQHLNGKNDWTPRLWAILMFQDWLESNK